MLHEKVFFALNIVNILKGKENKYINFLLEPEGQVCVPDMNENLCIVLPNFLELFGAVV